MLLATAGRAACFARVWRVQATLHIAHLPTPAACCLTSCPLSPLQGWRQAQGSCLCLRRPRQAPALHYDKPGLDNRRGWVVWCVGNLSCCFLLLSFAANVAAGAAAVGPAGACSTARLSPLPLPLPAAEVQQQFGIRSTVLNDFEAVGYGVPVLTENDLVTLNDVPAEDKVGRVWGGVRACGAGVGLGCRPAAVSHFRA